VNAEATKINSPITRIIICGGGLAAHMTAAMLSRNLPASIQITWVKFSQAPDDDSFLGNVAPPAAYGFNLLAGVSEPLLLLNTSTAFSWGTQIERWGIAQRSWVQGFQLPLPILGGVLFHHYLARLKVENLQPFLVSAMAARSGVFAHPNASRDPVLARGEYGYQFDSDSYSQPFAAVAAANRVIVVPANISSIDKAENVITAVHTTDGQALSADLYVDCTGSSAQLLSTLGSTNQGTKYVRVLTSLQPASDIGTACRTLTAHSFGWQSDTPLQGRTMRVTVCAKESESEALLAHGQAPQRSFDVMLGSQPNAWLGNCVAIGQAAAVIEPLTHAPMLLLQRQIERLSSLIPCSTDMSVESREFNRQTNEDNTHADLFNRAMFETQLDTDAPYWRAAREQPMHDKLAQKITQFESRGLLVAFDLEPFNPEDWIILHNGMGRRPERYDRVADRAGESQVRDYLADMRRHIEMLVKGMPTHKDYMAGIVRYLKQQGH